MKKYKSVNKKLSMLVATVLLTSPSILTSAVETPTATPVETTTPVETATPVETTTPVETPVTTPVETTTPVTTPAETPVETPVTTPVETPVTTPVTTPAETPVTTPVETPVTTPVETPVTTPIETPATTPVETPVETPVTTPIETPVETHEVGILDAKGNPIKDWSAVTIYKSNGGQPEKEVGIFYADSLEKGIADLKDGAYIAHLEASSSFITFNNNKQIPFSIKNGVLSTDIKFISNEVTGLIDFSSLLESSSYFYVTDSRGNSVKMYAHTNFAIQSLPVGTYTVTKMKNLAETEGATHTITITSGVVKAVGIDDDVPSETPSDVPSEIPSDVPSETQSDAPSETPTNDSIEPPSETLNSYSKVFKKSNSAKTGDTSSALYLMAAVGSLLGIKHYNPRHARR